MNAAKEVVKASEGRDPDQKTERHKWAVVDKPGRLIWIDVAKLSVDRDYQRDEVATKAIAIAKKWSWVACGVITVACRDDAFYIVDGQHRVAAAKRRADIDALPCVVFNTTNSVEEAVGFLNTNLNRKALVTAERFRALLVTGDPTAQFVLELIESIGRTVRSGGSNANCVTCLSTLMRASRDHREALIQVWPVIADVSRGGPLHGTLVEGLLYIEANLPDGETLRGKKWRERVMRCGADGLVKAANTAAAFYAKGGAKVWAQGMLRAINKGCRTQLVLPGNPDAT